MAQVRDIWGALYQNLTDAGCDPDTAQQCVSLAQQNKDGDLIRLLSSHRFLLMEDLHAQQRKIDCLDFLLYQLGKGHMGK